MTGISKKIISLLLSILMLFTLTSKTFAQSKASEVVTVNCETFTIQTSADGVRTVTDNSTGSVVTYNSTTGEVVIKEDVNADTISINLHELIRKNNVTLDAHNEYRKTTMPTPPL